MQDAPHSGLIGSILCGMQLVDRIIQSCPIDTRRALYGNIVLSVRTLSMPYMLPSASFCSVTSALHPCCVHACAGLGNHACTFEIFSQACPPVQGGSTMFRDFGRRLQRDVQRAVDGRMAEGTPSSGVQANVISHPMQRYAVWCGGSVLASMPHFPSMCVTRAQYDESGAGICRHGAAFRDGLG